VLVKAVPSTPAPPPALTPAPRRAETLAPATPPAPPPAPLVGKASDSLTEIEMGLVHKMYKVLPHRELLNVLNERRSGNPKLAVLTLEDLAASISSMGIAPPRGDSSWLGTRKLLAAARRSGTLSLITEQLIDDFAIVYSLNARQVMTLKDVALAAADEERAGVAE
jgi:hypothetical protein